MGQQLSPALQTLLTKTGQSWPASDEDGLQAMGSACQTFAGNLEELAGNLELLRHRLSSATSGATADAAQRTVGEASSSFRQLAQQVQAQGDYAANSGGVVHKAKIDIAIYLSTLAAATAALLFFVPFTLPLILAAIAAAAVGIAVILTTVKAKVKATVKQSQNWSGYIKNGSGISSTSVSWTVPTVSASSGDTHASDWVGIDGWGDGNGNLIQTGTEEDYINGKAHYQAWWEILPSLEVPITGMTISPGDSMTGSIQKESGNEWKITLTDNTTGQSFSTTQTYNGPGSSAEFIQETPSINSTSGHYSDPAAVSPVTFSGATIDGKNAGLTSSDEIVLTRNGSTLYQPSAPNSAGDGFTVVDPSVPSDPSPTVTPGGSGGSDPTVNPAAPGTAVSVRS